MKTILIVHTRADGTLIKGSVKGDGVWEIVRQYGFRSSRTVGLYLPHSRDRAAKQWNIDAAAAALREAGFAVGFDIDNITPGRSFAEAEADRAERAEERAYRYAERAGRNLASSEHRWANAHRGLPEGGEPIKIGHHSEGRHRRALERAHEQCRKAVEEGRKGEYWAQRAAAAGAYEQHRKDPGRTMRRIEKLEADRRRIERAVGHGWQKEIGPDGTPPENATLVAYLGGGWSKWRIEPSAEWHAEKRASLDAIDDELGYWRHVLAEAEAAGVKIWGKDDFAKGDFVIYHGVAVEVMRVNAKSLTIPWSHLWITAGPVATVQMCREIQKTGDRLYTDTLPYDKVAGRLTREEVLAEGLTVADVKKLIAERVRQARGR